MTEAILSIAAAALVIGYWIMCRRVALGHQKRVGQLLVEYFAREDVSDADKDAAYTVYSGARHWLAMPLMTLAAAPMILLAVFAGKIESLGRADTERNDIMDTSVQMYITRNPITSIACMFLVFTFLSVVTPFGFLFNTIKSIPSPSTLYRSTAAIFSRLTHKPL